MIINLKSQTDLSGIYVVYQGSTNIESPGIYGISHLMEHLVCKSLDHLQDDLEKDGIEHNAYTSNNEIVFYMTGLDEKLKRWKYNFVELLGNFNVSKEDFENEKNIVIQEYYNSFNDKTSNHILNLHRKLYQSYSPIGLIDDLKSMKFMDCIKFFELQYLKPTKIIHVSKNSKFNMDMDFAAKRPWKKFTFNPDPNVPLELGSNPNDPQTSLLMISPLMDDKIAEAKLANLMFSMGLNSPLYKEVREKNGLVYYIGAGTDILGGQGVTTINTMCTDDNAPKVIEEVRKVFKNYKSYLTKERFDIIKERIKIDFKKSNINRYKSVDRWINDTGLIYNIIDDVKFKDIMDVVEKYFDFDKFYISMDKKEFQQ